MKNVLSVRSKKDGFTAVELLVAVVIFGIIVIGCVSSFNSIRHSYMTARQLNEMYAVLSACPEVDRALEYTSLSSGANCYPNNTFQVENSATGQNSYSPTLAVTDTSALPASDPLKTVPDSKTVDISVGFPVPNTSAPVMKLRLLITRNGIGQL